MRFTLIDQPARLVRPGGQSKLRFAVSAHIQRRIEYAVEQIAIAA